MKKQVYEIDGNGYLEKIHIAEFDEVNPKEQLPINYVVVDPPQGLYRPKWTGSAWVEDMSQAEIDALNQPTPEQEIINLKKQLAETDYKIIKCSEYQLTGLETPYDIVSLHAERQTIRDRINGLEAT